MEDKSLIFEKYRIIIAKELDVPPDDIDLEPILKSVFRAIRESCKNNEKDEFIITIKDKEEEEAILDEHGVTIIKKIFDSEPPFENIVEDYRDWYISILEE